MHRFQAGAGTAQLEVGPLRPCEFQAHLSISVNSVVTDLDPPDGEEDGVVFYNLTSDQVHVLRTNPTAFLSLATAHTRIHGAPDNSWGWRYRIVQSGQSLPAVYLDDDGEQLSPGDDGFLYSSLKTYVTNEGFTDETVGLS